MRIFAENPAIEPLESRIAPAVVFQPNLYSDQGPVDPHTGARLHFVHASDSGLSAADASIAALVGDNSDVYFIRLSAGDDLSLPSNVSSPNLVNVTAGNIVAFFTDQTASNDPNHGVVMASELTGLSLGKSVSVAVGGAVNGDVVTNYNDVTGTIGATTLLPNPVTSLAAGTISGAFVSGGNVSQFIGSGFLHQVLTGTAANNYAYNFDNNVTASQTLSVAAPAPGVAGPSFSNAFLDSAGAIHTGDGGAGAAGGSISKITFSDDTTGFTIVAGAGGAGVQAKTSGGAGGNVSNVIVNGPFPGTVDTTPNSLISITAGGGGQGFGTGKGGAGGSASQVYIDYASANVNSPAVSTVADDVLVQAGDGGAGSSSGAGGGLTDVHLLTSTPHQLSGGAEFQLLAGKGGTASGGSAGAGGSVNKISITDVASPAIDPLTGLPNDMVATSPTLTLGIITSGDGGLATVNGGGGSAGSINGVTLKGFAFDLSSGAGGAGISKGGSGGAISNVTVLGSVGNLPGDNIHTQDLVIQTGIGGDASAGNAGSAGSINGVTISNADFGDASLAGGGLQIYAAQGGLSGKGAGGAGGSISNVQATSIDFATDLHPQGATGVAKLTSGGGGDGTASGGAGGSMSNVNVVGTRLNLGAVSTGAGGNGGLNLIAGKGGAGGTMTNVVLNSTESLFSSTPTGGFLIDSSQDFSTVKVGDVVTDTTNSETATVTAVDTGSHELLLSSNIFASGNAYSVDSLSGTSQYASATLGLLKDTSHSFSGVAVGNSFTDNTTSETGNVIFVDVAAHELVLNNTSLAAGDNYTVNSSTPVTGTAQDTTGTIIDLSVNFPTLGVTNSDTVQDISATASAGAPVTGFVTAVGIHELAVNAPVTSTFNVLDPYQLFGHSSSLVGGIGGSGNLSGAGGAGGSVVNSHIITAGHILLQAGNGGAGGATGASGAGGSLNGDGAFSSLASTVLTAGDASATGGKAGAGGGISTATIQALASIQLTAGDGANGGAGGSITNSGFSGPFGSSGFVPSGANISVQAGNGTGGSASTGAGGAGGSINGLTGFISSGQFDFQPSAAFTTSFNAGTGGDGTSSGGAGGSVNNVSIFGGGGPNVTFYIDAGDAGNATKAGVGATGGSITNIGGGAEGSHSFNPIFSIDPNTDFHNLSAGNGGDTSLATGKGGKGGLGGSVSGVHVNATIGLRSRAAFGMNLSGMGGISAGAGGTGVQASGLAGNVTNISADAIASIVAGHIVSGQGLQIGNLANKVDGITLNGDNAPQFLSSFSYRLSFGAFELTDTTQNFSTASPGDTVTDATTGLTTTVTSVNTANHELFLNSDILAAAGDNYTDTTANITSVATGGNATMSIPGTASNITVANALNSVASIQSAGGVGVAKLPNGGYKVTFVNDGTEPSMTGVESIPANATTQQIGDVTHRAMQDVTLLGQGNFTLSFQGQTTPSMMPNDSTTDVAAKLNALSTITSAGGVTVANGPNGSSDYVVTFNTPGAVTSQITGVESLPLNVQNSGGSATTQDVQSITFPVQGVLDPVQYSTANFVGSIQNPFRANAVHFQFKHSGTTELQGIGGASFAFGDVPLDGLIAATNLTANKNFAPEMYVTADASGQAFDVDNINS